MKSNDRKLAGFFRLNWYLLCVVLILIVSAVIFFRKTTPKPPKIKASKSSDFVFETKNTNFSAQIGASKSPKPFISFTSKAGGNVAFQMEGREETSIEEKDNKVTFKNVNNNTDVSYTPLANGIKEEIAINQPTERAEYSFDISTVNANPRKTLEGNYSRFFFNDEGQYQFHLDTPFAVDASGQRTEDIIMKIRKSSDSDNKYQILLALSESWLKSKDRVFPVIIDPTILYDTSSEFAQGQLNRIKDVGSGSSPLLETYYQELSSDPYTAGLWHLNEASGNALDSTGNANTGTPTGTTIVSGIFNNARSFNGTTDFINAGNGASLPKGDLTLEAWIKTSSSSDMTIVSHGASADWLYWFGPSSGTLVCKLYQPGSGSGYLQTAPTISLGDGVWHHTACTVSGTTISVYVDGKLLSTSSTTSGVRDVSTAGNLYIGKFDYSSTYNFNGLIDEVRISNTARSAEDIKASASRRPNGIYTSDVLDFNTVATWNPLVWGSLGIATGDGETLKDSTSLIAQWNLNETSGTTATNNAGSCGSNCNGTLVNFSDTTVQDPQGVVGTATGGTISYSNGYTIHTFTTSGTFTPSFTGNVEVLVVAGGGGGGGGTYHSGGGGAGGLVYNPAYAVVPGAITVTVGTGGAGGVNTTRGTSGLNSVFGTITAIGGGGGANYSAGAGLNGGSGGGSTYNYLTPGTGTAGQGYAGGVATTATPNYGAGGGGGAGGVGGNGTGTTGGVGGPGITNSISGAAVCYAGGGGGSTYSSGTPGTATCGGGAGSTGNGASGTANTGGGGGGAERAGTTGGTGGSGIVIVRYTANPSGWTSSGKRWGAGALMFDGADEYITVPNSSDLNPTTISLEAWYKPNSLANYHNIIDKRNAADSAVNYLLQILSTTGYVQFASRPTKFDFSSRDAVEVGRWNHIVATFDGSTAKIYINGKLSNSASYSGSLSVTSDNSLKICRHGVVSNYYCNGVLDSTRIYSRALTPAEIISNYQAGNIELQTRVGDSLDPNDGTWEEWRSVDGETVIENFNDNSNISTPSSSVYTGALISQSTSSFPSIDGSNNLKLQTGQPTSLTNVVGLWHLDETSGTGAYIKDSSPNSNDGTPTNTTSTVGVIGRARYIGGGSNAIAVPDHSSLNPTNITIESWIRPTGTSSGFVVYKYNSVSPFQGYALRHGNIVASKISCWVGGSAWTTSVTSLPNYMWSHVACTYDGTNVRVYINGTLDVTQAQTATLTHTTPLSIGSGSTNELDEIRISNVARSPEEIAESYRLGRDHYINKTISPVDLSNKTSLPFYIAADRTGSYLSATIGESAYVNNQTDSNTIAKWSFDDSYGPYPRSCYTLKLQGNDTDGVYTIDPDGDGGNAPLQVYCNMTYDGGGWTMMVKSWYGSGMIGNPNAVGAVTDATTLKGNPYKLADNVIRNIIGPSKNFDIMSDQNGYNTAYSTGNYEFVVIRNYTADFTYERVVPASSTTTTFQSYRISDKALAWTGNLACGIDASTGGAGISCNGDGGMTNNPQGGAGCTINMGSSSNVGWHHFFMNLYNDDTYVYICNGAQHSSSYNLNHRFWVRERNPIMGATKDTADKGEPSNQIAATGGTISTVDGYKIHTFTSSGTFQVTSGTGAVEALVVAGGGGGGMDMGGGGGAGGLISTSYAVSPQSYTVTVGNGGAGGPAAGTGGQPSAHQFTLGASNGQNSVLGSLTAVGGGAGGSSYYGHVLAGTPSSGGSGGGPSGYAVSGTSKAGGAATAGQGNAGGSTVGTQYYSAGGGGAGGVGTGSNNLANGGIGVTSFINGNSVFYAGGGGGSGYTICGGHGGQGGGGGAAVCTTRGGSGTNRGSAGGGGTQNAQTNKPGGNAGANTGGGGGGGSHYNATNKGGDGGSGVVIVRYPVSVTNNITTYGAVNSQGKIGKAKFFNGSTNHISLGDRNLFDGKSDFTFDAWVYPTSQTASTHYRVYSEQFVAYLGQFGDQVSFYMGNGSAWVVTERGGGTLGLNRWNHVAWVKSGTNYYIYINGQLTKTGSNAPATLGTTSNTNYIGTYDGFQQFWSGGLDELRLSDNVRTTSQIRQVFEMEKRTFPITIDFAAKLNGNFIVDSNDLNFNIDTTLYGSTSLGSNLYVGDKIIIKENVNGTEYLAQGTVVSTNSSGNTAVSSWDVGSTFPTGGFTANASVFKWQREYWKIKNEVLDSDIDAVTNITLRVTDGNQGRNIWIDDLRSSGGYLTNSSGATIQSSTGKRYAQYRAIYSSFDEAVSASLYSVNMSAVSIKPEQPTNLAGTALSSTSIRWDFTDNSGNEDGNKIYDTTGNTLYATNNTPNSTSITETGLIPNTQYTRKVAAFNTNGNSFMSASASKYTLANVPTAPTVTRTLTSASVVMNLNSNPSTTFFALYKELGDTCDGVGGSYIAANGSDNGDTAVWRTQGTWMATGSRTISGLDEESNYSFCVKARNEDGVETAFSPTSITSGNIVPISGDLTLNNTSTLLSRYKDGGNPNRYIVGLDTVGAGNTNSSQLNLNGGTLTLNSDETLVVGKLNLGGGTLFIANGATVAPGAKIWALDRDADGYPDRLGGEIKLWYHTTAPVSTISASYFRRKGLLGTLKTPDCDDNLYSSNNVCCTDYNYYVDADGDGYGAGNPVSFCQVTPSTPVGYSTNNTDCGPNNANAKPGSSFCSATSFTNASGSQSYDYNCSANGGAGTYCGTAVYANNPQNQWKCVKSNFYCVVNSISNCIGAQVGCGQGGYLSGAPSWGYYGWDQTNPGENCCFNNQLTCTVIGAASTQQCN